MMSLTADQMAKAKAEAKELLEYSIFVSAATLAVDLDAIDGEYQNPYESMKESNADLFESHESLRLQIAALNRLNS